MIKNIIDKIWDNHTVYQEKDSPCIFYIDKMLMHEVTSAQAFFELENRGLKVKKPKSILATIDHSIPTTKSRNIIKDLQARKQVNTLRENCKKHNIDLYDFDSNYQGIVHVMGPDLGFVLPGETLVCGDSHTSTHGAFGCLAFGVGTTEILHVLATQTILQNRPKTMKVEFIGIPKNKVFAKDIIMKLISKIGIGGATGHIIEYTGDIIKSMSMEQRMTLCNMSIECGARAGLISPDEITFSYLKGKKYAPKGKDFEDKLKFWESLKSPPNAFYDKKVSLNIENLRPMITWGINPEQAIEVYENIPLIKENNSYKEALNYTKLKEGQKLKGQKINWAFIGSCTNGRIEDLEVSAKLLKNKKIAKNVTMYIVPGSEKVLSLAKQKGLDKIFKDAGADFRMPGCSMCLAMNDDKVPAGERCISTSNRNFIGRQGALSITHLASPETVTVSAIKGYIADINDL